jgi:hypothetical protein
MRRIGVTATRKGLSVVQVEIVSRWLSMSMEEARGAGTIISIAHGDCIGGDATIDARAQYVGAYRIVHPGPGEYRAYCLADEIAEPKPFLDRDRDIVEETEELWAFPGGMSEQQRGSGTWYTVHYAQKHNTPVTIVWPNGTVEHRD